VTAQKKAMTAKKTKKQTRIPAWTALHFSLANPEGRGQGRLPRLLNRLADEIRSLGDVEVMDITFHTEVTDDAIDRTSPCTTTAPGRRPANGCGNGG
jgi:hypothetical protein